MKADSWPRRRRALEHPFQLPDMPPQDPLVKPKQPGASHIHDFFGPKVVSDNATIGTLASQPTSCSFDADRSAYWVPALYSKGVLQEGDAIQAYYFLDKGSRAPPKGLAMLAGDPKLNRTQPGKGAGWACGPESNYGQTFPPNCSPDGWLLVQVDFPSCWVRYISLLLMQ